MRFEKKGLDTGDPTCSMMFSFLSAVSQDESRSISENVKWAYRERFKRGEYNLSSNRVLGFDCEYDKLVLNDDADVIQSIFQMFLDGKTPTEIACALDQEDVVGRDGKPLTPNGILYILGNESFVGDKLLQKRAPKNFLIKQPERNATFESNYLADDHEAIIDRETWDAVQEILKKRRDELDSETACYHGDRTHFLYGKVFCADCGTLMTRRTLRCSSNPENKKTYKAWTCKERHKGRKGNGYKMRTIWEEELLAEISRQMGCVQGGEFPDRVGVSRDRVAVQWAEQASAC